MDGVSRTVIVGSKTCMWTVSVLHHEHEGALDPCFGQNTDDIELMILLLVGVIIVYIRKVNKFLQFIKLS